MQAFDGNCRSSQSILDPGLASESPSELDAAFIAITFQCDNIQYEF